MNKIILLFQLSIVTSVFFHNFLHLPLATGMMLGLAYLGFYPLLPEKKEKRIYDVDDNPLGAQNDHRKLVYCDLFRKAGRAEGIPCFFTTENFSVWGIVADRLSRAVVVTII